MQDQLNRLKQIEESNAGDEKEVAELEGRIEDLEVVLKVLEVCACEQKFTKFDFLIHLMNSADEKAIQESIEFL